MKKFIVAVAGLIAITSITSAQSLEEIIKRYSSAIKADQLSKVSTIKITGKMSSMGMEMPMTMQMKKPNKIRVAYNLSGQEIISVFDGQKGYMVNPMTGSSSPVELTGDQLKQVQNNNVFNNQIQDYFTAGILTLEGSEDVKGKPAFKLKAVPQGSSPVFIFIDKETFLPVKTSTSVEQMGTTMNVESFLTDYVDVKGVVMPKKTTAMANGMEAAVISFDNIEVDVPIDDAVFRINK
ncbi:MAG: hypothetical protein HPY62_05485 [Bacteroidales bacterium]|nr:hypothetical protein [Bacteroidales bacterium]